MSWVIRFGDGQGRQAKESNSRDASAVCCQQSRLCDLQSSDLAACVAASVACALHETIK